MQALQFAFTATGHFVSDSLSDAPIGGCVNAFMAAVALLVFHAVSKCLLFLCVGEITHITGSRNIRVEGTLTTANNGGYDTRLSADARITVVNGRFSAELSRLQEQA